jgi:hypothetical protein
MHGMLSNREVREEPTLERSSPNNRIERGGMDKVLRRGRDGLARKIFMCARVREALACARSCERYAPRDAALSWLRASCSCSVR